MINEEILENLILGHIAKELKDEIQIGRQINLAKAITQALRTLRIHDFVGRSEQLHCNCSIGKGLDHDEDGMPYCIECQKPVQ